MQDKKISAAHSKRAEPSETSVSLVYNHEYPIVFDINAFRFRGLIWKISSGRSRFQIPKSLNRITGSIGLQDYKYKGSTVLLLNIDWGCPSLKVHKIFPKVSFPPWLHPVKIWRQTVSG